MARKRYRGLNGLNMWTARTYATEAEAMKAIERKTRDYIRQIKANGPMPLMWTKVENHGKEA